MRLVCGLLLACAVAASGTQSASAADVPARAPVYKAPAAVVTATWSGFYAGGEVGGAWSRFDLTHVNDNYFNTLGPIVVGRDISQTAVGVIGGAFAGYNHQMGPYVLGLEVSVSGTSLKREEASPLFPAVDVVTSQLKWMTTATGRIGYAQGPWLVYAKGGYAGADVETTILDSAALILANSDRWTHGWTIGAGVEHMLGNGVFVGLTYNYVELNADGATLDCPACGTGLGAGTPVVDNRIRMHSVMARMGVQFGR